MKREKCYVAKSKFAIKSTGLLRDKIEQFGPKAYYCGQCVKPGWYAQPCQHINCNGKE